MTILNSGGRVSILVAIGLAGLVAAGLVFALPSLWTRDTTTTPKSDLAQAPAVVTEIPPIDATSPTGLETATFALG